MDKSKSGPDAVLEMLRNMAINRAYKPMSDDELWEQLRKWLVVSGKLMYFDKPKRVLGPKEVAKDCSICYGSGNMVYRYEGGEPVYAPCSCQRKRITP